MQDDDDIEVDMDGPAGPRVIVCGNDIPDVDIKAALPEGWTVKKDGPFGVRLLDGRQAFPLVRRGPEQDGSDT